MRISDWGSDVCSSDLAVFADVVVPAFDRGAILFLPRRLARLLHLGGKAGLAGFADVDAELPGLFDQFGIQRDVGRPFRGRLLGAFESLGPVHRHSPFDYDMNLLARLQHTQSPSPHPTD